MICTLIAGMLVMTIEPRGGSQGGSIILSNITYMKKDGHDLYTDDMWVVLPAVAEQMSVEELLLACHTMAEVK